MPPFIFLLAINIPTTKTFFTHVVIERPGHWTGKKKARSYWFCQNIEVCDMKSDIHVLEVQFACPGSRLPAHASLPSTLSPARRAWQWQRIESPFSHLSWWRIADGMIVAFVFYDPLFSILVVWRKTIFIGKDRWLIWSQRRDVLMWGEIFPKQIKRPLQMPEE